MSPKKKIKKKPAKRPVRKHGKKASPRTSIRLGVNKPIRIRANDGLIEDADCRVRLSIGYGDTVTWKVVGNGGPFTISFAPRSPFTVSSFVVSKTAPHTPTIDPLAPRSQPLKYTVSDQFGNPTDDPDVIIEN